MTQYLSPLLSGVALIAMASPALAQETDPALQDVIIVAGSRLDSPAHQAVTPDAAPLLGSDITLLTARIPGAARIGNGELSGQMQYRGLFGERLNLRVDGQRFASGGPNLMDPVFHYAPAPLVQAVIIDRGVSPVSAGPGLAGGADAVFKRIGFGETGDTALHHDFTVGGRSVNDSLSIGGVVGAASADWRVNLLGAWEEGSDTGFADGVIGGTGFERGVFGLSAGARTTLGEVSLDLRRQNTGPSGNPPFPMDIQYFDTDFARLAYAHDFGAIHLDASVHVTDVTHLMDNFSLRPSPAAMQTRASLADATTRGGEIALGLEAWGGRVEFGVDTETVDHHVSITNPANADFIVTPFPDIRLERTGAFIEWTGPLGPVQSQVGLRVDQNCHDAGTAVLGSALPMAPRMLANAFNAADRSGDELTVDAVARVWTPVRNHLSWRATLARKQQVPGYIQRYGWLPISASGGLADGNIYVGDLALEPETAWITEIGFDYASARAYLRPTLYYRQVDNYIQGTPFDATPGILDTPVEMIAGMNGDPTPLLWRNTDARLYGFDLDGGYDLDGPLRIDAVLNYVRGERRDIDDNLYRIAPPSLQLGLTWEASVWSATLEARAVAEQDRLSATNSETATDGYVVLTAYGDWQVRDGVRLSLGVENLLDEAYQDHLSGFNRNSFGDVPVGERLPGSGRGAFLRLSIAG
jgi:iron complex outermembrane recepter protein